MLCGLLSYQSEPEDTIGLGLQEAAVGMKREDREREEDRQHGPSSHCPWEEPILILDRRGEFLQSDQRGGPIYMYTKSIEQILTL